MKSFKVLCIAVLAAAFIIPATGCKKWKASRRLDGTWNISSFTIDGEEMIGSSAFFASVKMKFTKDDKTSGDVETTTVSSSVFGGSTDITNATYVCNDDEIVYTYTSGDTETYDMDLDKDEMTLSGNIDGDAVVIKGDKD